MHKTMSKDIFTAADNYFYGTLDLDKAKSYINTSVKDSFHKVYKSLYEFIAKLVQQHIASVHSRGSRAILIIGSAIQEKIPEIEKSQIELYLRSTSILDSLGEIKAITDLLERHRSLNILRAAVREHGLSQMQLVTQLRRKADKEMGLICIEIEVVQKIPFIFSD